MKDLSAAAPFPDLAPLVARLAAHHGLDTVVNAGAWWPPEVELMYPKLTVLGDASRGVSRVDPAHAAIVVDASRMGAKEFGQRLDGLGRLVHQAPLIVVGTENVDGLTSTLRARALEPFLTGRTRATSGSDEHRAGVLIIDRIVDLAVPAPRDAFRVVAIMTVYNEEDVLAPSLAKLIDDGVEVYVIDNWSTDGSFEIARSFEGRGLVGLERFPAEATPTFRLQPLLQRVEQVAADQHADWNIHHDVDERRSGPWPGIGLRESLWRVQSLGFSAIDHTVLNFRPVDDTFEPGSDFERHFRFFEFGRTRDLVRQVKAWKNDGRVDLASSAGHEARFVGRRVFPYKFLIKHYPIRSQAHGDRKILRDRVARWDPTERARGWHVQYNAIEGQQSFLRDPADLIEDRGAVTRASYLPEIIAGASLEDPVFPSWALSSRTGRALYRRTRRLLLGDRYERVRRSPLLRPAFVRRPLAALRATLLEGRSGVRRG